MGRVENCSEIIGALGDTGCTIPGQAWACWNQGPGPGAEITDSVGV